MYRVDDDVVLKASLLSANNQKDLLDAFEFNAAAQDPDERLRQIRFAIALRKKRRLKSLL
jgi:hypothetical protein